MIFNSIRKNMFPQLKEGEIGEGHRGSSVAESSVHWKLQIGESVGFHVRLHYQRLREQGGVMFCTTGMLLQGLHSNPTLKGVSHVIVDEVHERSLQKYFEAEEATVIKVPGALSAQDITAGFSNEPGSQPFINYDLVVDVIKSIQNSRPPGAILCFLPGWQDIRTVQARLTEDKKLESKLWVLPLHSRLSSSDQEQIFEEAPEGRRKVVLATNLAETSLTVQDVIYVVDTGCHKEHRYDPRKNLSILANHWISRANSQQRAGRAGRVQPGEVFHLYSLKIHNNMDPFPVPEIMRIPLEHVILQCKAHCGDESMLSFLSEGLSVPSRRLISKAVSTLEDLGMLKILDQGATENSQHWASRCALLHSSSFIKGTCLCFFIQVSESSPQNYCQSDKWPRHFPEQH
ncbi:ATP-dependent RNA helicase DHX30-like [Penaeus monodon]|uniref:ATP-dependent RNA helicase DHX30-like n=1 Tax=Penaeus monodon TaxID=6687 RepID=UPI0018A724C8|nr:ATP-dependent RNA helicase DHX30-like [Penaeus monodon]